MVDRNNINRFTRRKTFLSGRDEKFVGKLKADLNSLHKQSVYLKIRTFAFDRIQL